MILDTTDGLTQGQVPGSAERAGYLGTAFRLGQRLVADAVWHGDRCNWVGGDPVELDRGGRVTYSALGPTLYAGTSGVALFLAALHAATAERAVSRVALGAMRQALSRADAVPRSDRLGAYAGWAGIALAAARVARLLDSAEMLDGASHLTRRLIAHREESAEFDLIGGRAGAIIALLCLRASLAEPAGLETAVRLGDELLDAAEWSGGRCSWAAPAYPRWRNLTGFSHGTAGVAIALLELYAETGEMRFREAAHAALAYERHWFDAAAGNWPDFRETSRRSARDVPFSFCTFWCHGAPGIALSRLRAREILGDAVFEAEARTALTTTRRALEDVLGSGIGNFSLCHGVAGNADVLLHGLQMQAHADARDREIVVQAAELGRRNYDGTARPWPCGTHAGETQNLMLGLAGIGYFYLRLSDPATPSVLLIGRAT